MNQQENDSPTRAEFLKKRHYEILMQVNYALVNLEKQPHKRDYILQKLKLFRTLFMELIPPHEVKKRGNKQLTKPKIDKMQIARRENAQIRKEEFEGLLHEFRKKNFSLSMIYQIETSSKVSIRNFLTGKATPSERFLRRFRELVKSPD